jgi:antiviral helicase SKI2
MAALETVVADWIAAGTISEVDWGRMRTLEFQEALRARNEISKSLQRYECNLCEHFSDHVSLWSFLFYLQAGY